MGELEIKEFPTHHRFSFKKLKRIEPFLERAFVEAIKVNFGATPQKRMTNGKPILSYEKENSKISLDPENQQAINLNAQEPDYRKQVIVTMTWYLQKVGITLVGKTLSSRNSKDFYSWWSPLLVDDLWRSHLDSAFFEIMRTHYNVEEFEQAIHPLWSDEYNLVVCKVNGISVQYGHMIYEGRVIICEDLRLRDEIVLRMNTLLIELNFNILEQIEQSSLAG